MTTGLILSLCDFTGNWPAPYAAAGYEVICIDVKRGDDVRMIYHLNRPVHGILAAPPCTDFAGCGSQYWDGKDLIGSTHDSLAIVDACLRAVVIYRKTLKFWVLENPVGRLRRWLGKPSMMFQPHEYGGYMLPGERSCEISPERDAYTKKTLLWGEFNEPVKINVPPLRSCDQGSWIQTLGGKSERTKELRSTTPLGFSRAFQLANP